MQLGFVGARMGYGGVLSGWVVDWVGYCSKSVIKRSRLVLSPRNVGTQRPYWCVGHLFAFRR